jgi:hypothetical protein
MTYFSNLILKLKVSWYPTRINTFLEERNITQICLKSKIEVRQDITFLVSITIQNSNSDVSLNYLLNIRRQHKPLLLKKKILSIVQRIHTLARMSHPNNVFDSVLVTNNILNLAEELILLCYFLILLVKWPII